MRISAIISYPLGWLIGANYRCARKSDPVLKLFRAGRGVCKDPFTTLGEVCSIFCQCFISHVILGSVHMYSLSSPTARRWISASASMHAVRKVALRLVICTCLLVLYSTVPGLEVKAPCACFVAFLKKMQMPLIILNYIKLQWQ